ncbi:MAG: hypothetical protein PHX83_15715 [Acidobacteriia bacterium]|nr:hypothetical protein [Terriglobia bacterium]
MKRAIILLLLALCLPLVMTGTSRNASTSAVTNVGAQEPPPPVVVAAFLNLSEAQAAQFRDLLNEFQTSVSGLQEQLGGRQNQLQGMLNTPGADPASVGGLVLEIHAIELQVGQAVQSFQSHFFDLLTAEQKGKVQAVALAAQLQPAVGAFAALRLIPLPPPPQP